MAGGKVGGHHEILGILKRFSKEGFGLFPDLSSQDIQLLRGFSLLNPEGKREVLEFLKFVSRKQYKAELLAKVMGNPLLLNGLIQAVRICEREDTCLEDALQKVDQLKHLYFNLVEKTDTRYDDLLEDIVWDDLVKDWARIGFENIREAAQQGRKDLLARELEEMIENLNILTHKKDKRRIIAV